MHQHLYRITFHRQMDFLGPGSVVTVFIIALTFKDIFANYYYTLFCTDFLLEEYRLIGK